MRLIDLDEFLRQNCIDRMEGRSCEECKHHVLEVSCERLMGQPTAEKVGKWAVREGELAFWDVCDQCGKKILHRTPFYNFCPNCGARMVEGEEDE